MREFDLPIQVNVGLRKDKRFGHGLGRSYAFEINRLVPREYGMRPALITAAAITPTPTVAFPYPQVFPQQGSPILLGLTSVGYIDDSVPTAWTVVDQPLFNYLTGEASATITAGVDPWDGSINEELSVYTNGASVIVCDRRGLLTGVDECVFVADFNVNTICSHKGRLIYGGFNVAGGGDPFWTDHWRACFEEFMLKGPYQLDYSDADIVPDNFVIWSGIRNGTDLWPLQPPAQLDWQDVFRTQQAGFSPMATRGSVLKVLPLGPGFIVYTEDAIYLARSLQVDAVLTYGFSKLADFGILCKGAVAGTESEHVFADERGDLFRLGADLKMEKLGYREFIGDNFGLTTVINYEPLDGDYWIAGGIGGNVAINGSDCYVLTQQGLGHSIKHPTSIHTIDGVSYGILETLGTDLEYRWVSEIVDFRFRDIKTIGHLEVGFTSPIGQATDRLMVAVDYCYDGTENFTRSAWIPLNGEGFARIQITALVFRIAVKWDSGTETVPELDYINVKWQPTGRRTARGVTSAAEAVV